MHIYIISIKRYPLVSLASMGYLGATVAVAYMNDTDLMWVCVCADAGACVGPSDEISSF